MSQPKKLSAGVVVARRAADGWRILALRAFRNWDFPKGLVEPGEDLLATAKREVSEETGLSDLDFSFGYNFCETLPYAGGKVARYYIAETRENRVTLPVSLELGRPEHNEWRWVTLDEAKDLLPPRLMPILDWARDILTAA